MCNSCVFAWKIALPPHLTTMFSIKNVLLSVLLSAVIVSGKFKQTKSLSDLLQVIFKNPNLHCKCALKLNIAVFDVLHQLIVIAINFFLNYELLSKFDFFHKNLVSVNAISCYQCNSVNDADCTDIENGPPHKKALYFQECKSFVEYGEHKPFCRKTVVQSECLLFVKFRHAD